MQAYAGAELTPLASKFRSPPADSLVQAAPASVKATDTAWLDGIVSPSSMLASFIVAALDDQNLAVLAHRLQPHLTRRARRRWRAASHTPCLHSPPSSVSPRRQFAVRSRVASCERSSEGRAGSSRRTPCRHGRRHQTHGAVPARAVGASAPKSAGHRCPQSSAEHRAREAHRERREAEARQRRNRVADAVAPTRTQSCPHV